MLLNCDIGERGGDYPLDLELMNWIDIANIACGGHAGDAESVRVFAALARQKQIKIAAHLSYPDQPNFGRRVMAITEEALIDSLAEQLAFMPQVQMVKLHGALYNESCQNPALADLLSDWLSKKGIREVIAPDNSELADCCQRLGIRVWREAFAERNYEYHLQDRRLYLVGRNQPHASIASLANALNHAREIILRQRVNVNHADSSAPHWISLQADTICIHSDSAIALDLAKGLRSMLGQEGN